ncbi:Uma2 family endonuclease [Cyanobacterium aponinum UTEX 3222]|uniref:Uma2 family endonuclease n=1 Tax=Cyanobacterium aponinum TaxID=379064 RepID=UPI00308FDCA1|nr:Uma2 family endonuclease [Cyanobacterium aponinum UTEX 3222]
MFTQAEKRISLKDFLQLPETKPIKEFINGYVYEKPMPKGKHSTIQTFLTTAINQQGFINKKCCAFTELRCNFDERSIVPNISIINWEKIPKDEQGEIANIIEIAPDWIIEILSPQQSSIRVIDNILFALNHGSQISWLIDPQERIIMTFLPNQQPQIKQNQDLLPVLSSLSHWQVCPQEIFNYLTFI